ELVGDVVHVLLPPRAPCSAKSAGASRGALHGHSIGVKGASRLLHWKADALRHAFASRRWSHGVASGCFKLLALQ
ncbi:hypothetical protein HAX54_028021, partial [Datura stramonium]|nr:hypothetical protein [Datura stramonium]